MPETTPQPPYPSVVANLFATGLHQVIFRTVGASARGTIEATAADFADSVALDNLVQREKAAGAIGTLVGERASMDLLRDVCRHGSNPWKLEHFESYQPSTFDLAVLCHGTLDGERAVWDQLIVPNLSRLGISVDPGVVPPTPGRPDPGNINAPLPGGQADPAMKLVVQLQEALRVAGRLAKIDSVPLNQTDFWKAEVAPLLAGPFLSGV